MQCVYMYQKYYPIINGYLGVVKYKLSALFQNLCKSCMSVRALLLLSSMHSLQSLGLGLDLGNSLDRRERTLAHAGIAEMPQIK